MLATLTVPVFRTEADPELALSAALYASLHMVGPTVRHQTDAAAVAQLQLRRTWRKRSTAMMHGLGQRAHWSTAGKQTYSSLLTGHVYMSACASPESLSSGIACSSSLNLLAPRPIAFLCEVLVHCLCLLVGITQCIGSLRGDLGP